ncbi:MAG: peptide MFS transporter [Pseudomonadota bacterium]
MSEAVAKVKIPADVVWGHPRGMIYIIFTEAWERFSFYGMQALLVLYLANHLLVDQRYQAVFGMPTLIEATEAVFGTLAQQALATQLFGLYVGFIYLAPIIGGWIGDRWVGRKRAVLAGALSMSAGHLLMTQEALTLVAIIFLIIGSGLLKGNLAAQVGMLYAPDDSRRDRAYTLYNVSINIGATLAPLACGTLGELYGWHYGFGAAGVGMLVGVVVYLKGMPYLPDDPAESSTRDANDGLKTAWAPLLSLFLLACLFWSAQAQIWNSYPLWISARVDRDVLGFVTPVTWFQSLDSFAVLVFSPIVLILWRWQQQHGREPLDASKLAIGFFIYACGFALLSLGELLSAGNSVLLVWPILLHFVLGAGFVYVGPIFLSMLSRIAPNNAAGTIIGAYYVSLFVGGVTSGWLGRFYEDLGPLGFWLIHAGLLIAGMVIIQSTRDVLNRSTAR